MLCQIGLVGNSRITFQGVYQGEDTCTTLKYFQDMAAAAAHVEGQEEGRQDLQPRTDVPSVAQFRLCYEVNKRLQASAGRAYEEACVLARRSGDSEQIPASCMDAKIGFKISRSITEALVEKDRRDIFVNNKVVMIGLAEDARHDIEMMIMSLVLEDFTVQVRMLGLHQCDGQATAIAKAEAIDAEITKLAGGDAARKERFQSLQTSFTSDGAYNEQLCPRMAKKRNPSKPQGDLALWIARGAADTGECFKK
jgi:hypothetical protein